MTNQPDWEKSYDNLIAGIGARSINGEKLDAIVEVKDFIRSTIQAEKEALIKEIGDRLGEIAMPAGATVHPTITKV